MKLISFLISSNIFISLAAVSLTIETQIQLGMEPQLHPYLFIIFFATLFEYNLHRLITVLTNKEALDTEKHKWVKKYPRLFYFLVVVSVVGFAFSLLAAKIEVLLTFAPVALVTIFYSIPLFKSSLKLFRLREIPFIKIFLISAVWSAVTIFLPVIESVDSFSKENLIFIIAERFVFVFAITIPFDIRDMISDEEAKLKTIPLLFGIKKSLQMTNFLLGIFILLCVYHYTKHDAIFILPAMILSAFSTMFFINNKKLQQNFYYHYGILDGTMFLQALFVVIFYYLFAG